MFSVIPLHLLHDWKQACSCWTSRQYKSSHFKEDVNSRKCKEEEFWYLEIWENSLKMLERTVRKHVFPRNDTEGLWHGKLKEDGSKSRGSEGENHIMQRIVRQQDSLCTKSLHRTSWSLYCLWIELKRKISPKRVKLLQRFRRVSNLLKPKMSKRLSTMTFYRAHPSSLWPLRETWQQMGHFEADPSFPGIPKQVNSMVPPWCSSASPNCPADCKPQIAGASKWTHSGSSSTVLIYSLDY